MTRAIPRAVLFALTTVVASHRLHAQSSPTRWHRIEREVRQASAEEVQALLANDVKTLARLWADDFVVTNPLNQFVHKQHVLSLIETDTLAFTAYDRQIEYVHEYGALVVVTGSESVVWAGKMPAAGKRSPLRFTALWMKRGDRWQEVARHANIVSSPRREPALGTGLLGMFSVARRKHTE